LGATLRFLPATAVLAACLWPVAARAQAPPPAQHYQVARAAFLEGNVDKAELEVRLALQDNPDDADSHFLLGCLLERRGENDQATVGFQRALAMDPTSPEALYNLGTMLLRRGEVVPASRLLENAVLVRPNHVPSYGNLGKAYFLAGLPELAVGAYEEALRRDPSNAVALRNLLLLAEAAGLRDAAASYRRRLDAIGSGRAGRLALDTGAPGAPGPTWPLAPGATGSRAAATLPDIAGLEPQPPPDQEADDLRDLLRDLTDVTVERRGGRLTLLGWTRSPREKEMLSRVLAGRKDTLDLTTDDVGDSQRMLEVDAIIFSQTKLDQTSVGFNFLNLVQMNFDYFAADHRRDGTGYTAPGTIGSVTSAFQSGWVFGAAVNYAVNIANASKQQVAVLARPHLTTLSGTPATFLAGGEIVFKVSGNISGDIKPYPFGTSLKVTPTLLRTPGEDGTPRVHIAVEAGRTSALDLLDPATSKGEQVNFEKVSVTSQTVIGLGQTLILSGLNQRESRVGREGVPGLMHVPILKYLFSTRSVVQADVAVMILLTPRDPAYLDQQNRKALAEFVEQRREFLRAKQGTPEDMARFESRYPDWDQVAPNRFASHFFLVNNSALYRAVSGQDMQSEALDLDLLGTPPQKKTP
jgi:Flp pilus assembly protein TadD